MIRSSKRILIALLSLIALSALAAGCYPQNPQSTFDPAGPVARDQLTLFYIIFWAGVFVFVAVEGALLYAVIKYRRKPGQGIPAQIHGNTPLEIGWTIAPAIVLAVIAVPTVTTIAAHANPPSPNPLRVTVIGHQWWWEFQYPDLNVVTANELHIPVGEVVSFDLQSDDVIHSFWVPKLGGKQDMVPTRSNPLWLKAEKAGVFYGQCAEFCGTAHAQMRLRVIAESKEEFQAWVEAQKRPPAAPTGDAARGATVFAAKGCLICHSNTVPEPPELKKSRKAAFLKGQGVAVAPNLTHFGSRTTLAAGLLDNTPENLERWLRNPDDVKPGNVMAARAPSYTTPALALNQEDIKALVAYLHSLK